MPSNHLPLKRMALICFLSLGTGVTIILVSIGVIPIDESTLHAPKWVIGLCGGVFSLAGIMIVLGEETPINNFLGGLLVLSFALIGGWIALFGEGDQFSEGIPILGDSLNISIARIMFGAGSLMCFAIVIYAFRLQFKSQKEPRE